MKLKFVFEKKSIHLKAMTKGYERLKYVHLHVQYQRKYISIGSSTYGNIG